MCMQFRDKPEIGNRLHREFGNPLQLLFFSEFFSLSSSYGLPDFCLLSFQVRMFEGFLLEFWPLYAKCTIADPQAKSYKNGKFIQCWSFAQVFTALQKLPAFFFTPQCLWSLLSFCFVLFSISICSLQKSEFQSELTLPHQKQPLLTSSKLWMSHHFVFSFLVIDLFKKLASFFYEGCPHCIFCYCIPVMQFYSKKHLSMFASVLSLLEDIKYY